MINRFPIFHDLYYVKGKQATNFRIFHNYKREDGEKGFSKWVKFLDATEKEINLATHRTILINEIVLDFDPLKGENELSLTYRVKQVCKDLKRKKISYECYTTGSRGFHIHIWVEDMFFMNAKDRQKFRCNIIKFFNAELQKNSENVPIALENVPHWKSGKIKERCEW